MTAFVPTRTVSMLCACESSSYWFFWSLSLDRRYADSTVDFSKLEHGRGVIMLVSLPCSNFLASTVAHMNPKTDCKQEVQDQRPGSLRDAGPPMVGRHLKLGVRFDLQVQLLRIRL